MPERRRSRREFFGASAGVTAAVASAACSSARLNGSDLAGRNEPTMVSGTMVWRAQQAQS